MSTSDAPEAELAVEFDHVYSRVYLAFHRRDGVNRELSAASRAVLTHLSFAGPITIGEATAHLDRAQSVVSDIVTQLESHGWVERRRDDADKRRVLIWLTPDGMDLLRRDSAVLGYGRLAAAITRVGQDEVIAALATLDKLVEAARPPDED